MLPRLDIYLVVDKRESEVAMPKKVVIAAKNAIVELAGKPGQAANHDQNACARRTPGCGRSLAAHRSSMTESQYGTIGPDDVSQKLRRWPLPPRDGRLAQGITRSTDDVKGAKLRATIGIEQSQLPEFHAIPGKC